MENPSVSIAIPVFNEEQVIDELLDRCLAVLDALPGSGHEVVLVDDGSSDSTVEKVWRRIESDERIKCVELARNFGHQVAVTAALDHVAGDVVFVMDGDLQDRPEELPKFLAKHAEGYEVVYARRVERKEGLLLRICYSVAYRIIGALSETPLPLDSGDYSLISRKALNAMLSAPERQRYVRGLRAWVGFRQIGIDVERDARFAGESKYSVAKLAGLAMNGLFSFSIIPLRIASFVGFSVVAMGLAYLGYAIAVRLLGGGTPTGFTAIIGLVVVMSGVQLLFLGIIGEYLGRVYTEVKRRPQYVVNRLLGGSDG